jgi:hypothetical protein
LAVSCTRSARAYAGTHSRAASAVIQLRKRKVSRRLGTLEGGCPHHRPSDCRLGRKDIALRMR